MSKAPWRPRAWKQQKGYKNCCILIQVPLYAGICIHIYTWDLHAEHHGCFLCCLRDVGWKHHARHSSTTSRGLSWKTKMKKGHKATSGCWTCFQSQRKHAFSKAKTQITKACWGLSKTNQTSHSSLSPLTVQQFHTTEMRVTLWVCCHSLLSAKRTGLFREYATPPPTKEPQRFQAQKNA